MRKSLGLATTATVQSEAEAALDSYVEDLKAKVSGKIGRGDPVAIAAARYLSTPRKRPLGASSVAIVKETVRKFGSRRGNEISAEEWKQWIDGTTRADGAVIPGRMTGRSASTRERFLSSLLAFLSYAKRHHGLATLPSFERDQTARNPNRRARRRVQDLRPELIQRLFDACHISIRAQLAVQRATGARVSSVIYAARVCDLILAQGREQITFPLTKNGEDVTAALDPTAVAVLKDYLKWRGSLHDREAPLFLTFRRQPYTDNGRAYGGQNKTAFRAAKRRAAQAILEAGETAYGNLMRAGRPKEAEEARHRAQGDAELIQRLTQHWFRHMLAQRWLRRDPRAAMEQGGWLDIRSVMGYSHDAPEYRRQLVAELDDLTANLPAGKKRSS
ncbi:tyrosine-type recombinase/integrase [Bradyrhizobium oligotrophicum]|uniref:tyrosine-type recombinase/integrase n=1 Tax=Bradyrhizobium oligotrophicum TaxID=44255 RepID=UPI003EBBBFC0